MTSPAHYAPRRDDRDIRDEHEDEPATSPSARRPITIDAIATVTTVSSAVLVGVHGPAPWPTVRAVAALAVGACCLRARRRAGPAASAFALLGLGLAGLIAGIGIGAGHLVAQPRSVEAVAGALTVAGALVLVATGSVYLVGRLRCWWKLLAVPIACSTLALVVLPLTLAVFVTNAPPFPASRVTPATRGLDEEDVVLVTADDVRLTGWYVASSNGAAVVLLGGISGISEHEVDVAAVLARHGYGVLLLNVRGQGHSEGDAMLWGWWGEIDVAAGIDFLAGRPDVVGGRIGAVGMSVGGEQAISSAGIDRRLRAVVSEGATARGARDEGDPARGVGGLLTRWVDWSSQRAASVMTDADTPVLLRESVAAFEADQHALLIAAGTSDQEIAASRVLRDAAVDRVDVWVAPDAAHTGAFRTHPSEWERRVVGFLEAALAPTAADPAG